ncbi:MAG: hypothetical protein Q8O52_18890, partial [Sulfuritalea sp.]|nr:hypothetical protein [Sulfuritalea sp.]
MKKIRMSRSVAALLIAFGCQTALAATNDPETPTTINGAKVVSVDEAKGLMGSVKFYDTRNVLNFGKG